MPYLTVDIVYKKDLFDFRIKNDHYMLHHLDLLRFLSKNQTKYKYDLLTLIRTRISIMEEDSKTGVVVEYYFDSPEVIGMFLDYFTEIDDPFKLVSYDGVDFIYAGPCVTLGGDKGWV